jgi:hypothetical protein
MIYLDQFLFGFYPYLWLVSFSLGRARSLDGCNQSEVRRSGSASGAVPIAPCCWFATRWPTINRRRLSSFAEFSLVACGMEQLP